MKTMILRFLIAANVMMAGVAVAQQSDPVKDANARNEKKEHAGNVNEDVAEFLVKSADARMMDAEEGKLAMEKGSSPDVKAYGKTMVEDQSLMLREIRKLAAQKNVTLPAGISEKKEDGREDLAEKRGEDFDKKFIRMMIIDHERDIKLFKEAIDFGDPDVAAFAKKYLQLIESHLDKIEAIKKLRE